MEIPQDRTKISRNSPTKKSPTIQSDDQILTHQTGTLALLLKAICIIDNTSPVEQTLPPLSQQTGPDNYTWPHPVKISTHHHCAARQTNKATGDCKKSSTMSENTSDRDFDNERPPDEGNATGGPGATVKAADFDQKPYPPMIQAAIEAGAKLEDLCANFKQLEKRKKRK